MSANSKLRSEFRLAIICGDRLTDHETMQNAVPFSKAKRHPRGTALRIAAGFILLGINGVLASDESKGLAKAAICASCHGPVGISPVPSYPNIAGQNPLYLEYALRRYRAGDRTGDQAGMMYTVTQALSDTDISDLAAYYGQLRPGR